jgi:hypothetical protein
MPPDLCLDDIPSEVQRRLQGLSDRLLHSLLEEKTQLLNEALADWTGSDEPLPYYPFACETEEDRRRWHAWEAFKILNHEVGAIRCLIDPVDIDDRTLRCARTANEIIDGYQNDVRGLTRHVGEVLSMSERWADKWLLRKNPHYDGGKEKRREQRWAELEAAVRLIVENHASHASDHEKT